ncbi:putative ankyrin repeat protein RF_0381 [Zophobas morio]|uniref:putative ankyrin repeat protein RF_0381 n=1 Tax=Zophobas morio TaxID=2755281 RepID=UPI003082E17D
MSHRPSKTDLLITAINSDDIDLLTRCMEQGADINATWPLAQCSIFSKAVEKDNFKIIEYLISKSPNLHRNATNKITPLIVAIRSNCSSQVMDILIKGGAKVNEKDAFGRTPLNEALSLNKDEIVQFLLMSGADVSQCDGSGKLPITLAVVNNRLEVVKRLFFRGADINQCDRNGDSALALAQRLSDPSILNYFEEKIAARSARQKESVNYNQVKSSGTKKATIKLVTKVETVPKEEQTSEDVLKEETLQDVTSFLQGKNVNQTDEEGFTPLARAIQSQNIKLVQCLLTLNANSCKTVKGQTPLQLAVKTQNLQIVQLLLQHGAEHTIQTALFEAVILGDLQIVDFLITKNVELNVIYRNGYTVLTKAIETEDVNIVKVLVKNGASVNMPDRSGKLPLIRALETGNGDISSYLSDKGATINNGDNNLSYFHQLIEDNNLTMVKALVELLKIDVDVLFETGFSPVTKAVERGNLQMVEYFLSRKNDIKDKVDGNKKCPLSIAAVNEDLPMVKFLINSEADVSAAKREIEEYANISEDFAIYLEIRDGKYVPWKQNGN